MNTTIFEYLDTTREESYALAKSLYSHPELALDEKESAKELVSYLEKHGFSVETGIAGMETAFKAVFGSGRPVIAYLAEYDALPGLGQECVPYRSEIKGPGHGCGHNLLGAGCVLSAAAVKEVMEKENLKGTLIVFGCPAEETLIGKVKMTQEGCFDEVDAAIAWHPLDRNCVNEDVNQAMDSKIYRFFGKTAHAAADPEKGRSALDAAELMNIGVNYLREHVPDHVRMHYSYDAAGEKPNIVPDFAQTSYYIRARDVETVKDVSARVDDIAKGAALMTGTRTEVEYVTGCAETQLNRPLCTLLHEAMKRSVLPAYTDEEREFVMTLAVNNGREKEGALREGIEPLLGGPNYVGGSTDVANVSHRIPTVTMYATTRFYGSPGHHWAVTALSGTDFACKGMVFAAQAMAEAVYDLLTKPEELNKAWAYHEEKTGWKRGVK